MDRSKTPQVGIIGAGIGGLSAAIALRRAGWQCEVFERSTFKNEIGAAIYVTPNATRCLHRWGFDFEKTRPTENRHSRMMSAGDLKVLSRQDYSGLEREFGFKWWGFHRVDLHKGLLDLAVGVGGGEGVPAVVRLGCEVKEVGFEKGTIVLGDGSCVEKDLIIVADGVHVSEASWPSRLSDISSRVRSSTSCREVRVLLKIVDDQSTAALFPWTKSWQILPLELSTRTKSLGFYL